jgi:hypothetical protein
MSEVLATPTKSATSRPTTTRNGSADLQMLAQVEKWMATIREISREQQVEAKYDA